MEDSFGKDEPRARMNQERTPRKDEDESWHCTIGSCQAGPSFHCCDL